MDIESAPAPVQTPVPQDPDWIRDSVKLTWDELRLYLRTLVLISLQPRRFGQSWMENAASTTQVMNPLGFMAMTIVIHGLTQQLIVRLMYGLEFDDETALWVTLLRQIGPYAYYAVLGGLIHGIMCFGGPTRRLRSSVAQALYVGAGPASLATLVSLIYFFTLRLAVGAKFGEEVLPLVHPAFKIGGLLLLLGTFLAFVIPLTKALGGVHQRRGFRLIGSVLLAFTIAGLLSGYVRLHVGFQQGLGSYMPELVLWLRRNSEGALRPFATLWF
jgi:hypothetical protein